jgi:UDP-N-acetylmuramoyl-tripeptide--D-alanyl-D-alanine ligase
MVGVRAAEIADHLVTVGPRGHLIAASARRAGLSSNEVIEFDDTNDAIAYLSRSLNEKDVVLVKGSNAVHMDRIVAALEVPA